MNDRQFVEAYGLPAADRRKSVLCVDDEPANLQVLKQILQSEYRLLFARDGQRALELAAVERPDLVLLDVMMPDMSGHQVCRQLKADPAMARTPVIFVTALNDVEDEAAGFALGATTGSRTADSIASASGSCGQRKPIRSSLHRTS